MVIVFRGIGWLRFLGGCGHVQAGRARAELQQHRSTGGRRVYWQRLLERGVQDQVEWSGSTCLSLLTIVPIDDLTSECLRCRRVVAAMM